jgi:hypothetical protein
MSTQMSLEKIDTSYWKIKDAEWVAQREAQWPAIERMVGAERRKSEINVIKDYFMRGKMPNWKKYKEWNGDCRHVDLKVFLWLHPSDDHEVLKELYKTYMESDLIHESDVIKGYGSFVDNEFLRASSSRKTIEEYSFPFMGAKNIILFRVLFEDVDYATDRIRSLVGGQVKFDKKAREIFEFLGYHHFLFMTGFLSQSITSPLCLNSLYQYADVLEWCLTTLTPNNQKEFLEELNTPEHIKSYQRELYCLHHFNTEKEGDTCRTHFIHNIRKILDERTFVPEFKQMWEDIKTGTIEVQDPWKRR